MKICFNNIYNNILLELLSEWQNIRVIDYKSINDYNRAILELASRLSDCGVIKTDDDLIKKTLSTFPEAYRIIVKQYRIAYERQEFVTFADLIAQLLTDERHEEILTNNNRAPARAKRPMEIHYKDGPRGMLKKKARPLSPTRSKNERNARAPNTSNRSKTRQNRPSGNRWRR